MRVSAGARHDFLRRFGLPSGWDAHTLGELARVVGGGTPSRDEHRFWDRGTIPWATPTDLTANGAKRISNTAECITEAGLSSSSAELLPAGSILYTSRATIGAKAVAAIPMATNQGFTSLVPHSVDADYLYYLLDVLTPIIKRFGAGTTFEEVSKRDIRTVWCAIPASPDEQHAVAGILNAADKALDRNDAAIEAAKALKNAILQGFFYEALGETAYANRPSKALPAGWALVETQHLLAEDPKNGVSPESSTQPPGTPTFSLAAIREGRVALDRSEHLKYVRVAEKVIERYRIRRGDVLVVRGNANPDLVGKAGMVDQFPEDCIYPDITMRVSFRAEGSPRVSAAFAVLAWNHALVHSQVLRRAKTSNGTLKINGRDVNQTVIPVPPDSEQDALVSRIAGVEAQLDALSEVRRALQHLKRALAHDLLTGLVRVPSVIMENLP